MLPPTNQPSHLLTLVALLGASAAFYGCGDNSNTPRTIADHVRADDRFSTLEEGLDQIGLLETLDEPGPYTLFAPTNAAFEALAADGRLAGQSPLAEPQLGNLLRHHVVSGELTVDALERLTAIDPLDGPEIHVRYGLDGVLLNDGARLVLEPIVAENGIIHVLDVVLARPLLAPVRTYERLVDMPLSDAGDEGGGFNSDFLTIEDEGAIHDLKVFVEVEHTDVSQLLIFLRHIQTLETVRLVSGPQTNLDNVNTTFADSAPLDSLTDFVPGEVPGEEAGPAFPAASYRALDPLEYMVGVPIAGEWQLLIFDFRPGETGRLVKWGLIASAGVEPPAEAIVFNPRRAGNTVFGRGFTETASAQVRRVGGLEGEIELAATAGELVGEPYTVPQAAEVGSVMFPIASDAPLGPREVVLSAASADVSRIRAYDVTVAQPDSDGVELLSHVPLPLLGANGFRGNDIWGWTDPQTGTEIALVGTSTGTAFVDLSDPRSPVVLGTLPTHSFSSDWRDIKVYQDHAFIVSEAQEHGLQVFDLTQLRGVTAPQTFAVTAHNDEFGNAHNIAINEDTGFAYVVGSDHSEACSGGLLMYDISTVTAPVSLGCFAGGLPAGQAPSPQFPTDVYIHDVQCVTYAGPDPDHQGSEICLSSDQDSVGIADVTDKGAVAQLSRLSYPGVGYTHQGWLTEDHRYFILNDEFDEFIADLPTRSYVFDVTDLDNPSLLGVIDNPRDAVGHNTYVAGNTAYQANYTSGLRLVDITDIASGAGVEVGYFDTYPDDDAEDDKPLGTSRCSSTAGARLLPHPTDVDVASGCGNVASFRGAWSSYPFFASGIIVVSDIDRGLFVLQPD